MSSNVSYEPPFERAVLSPAIVSAVVAQMHPETLSIFKDSYMVELLELPREHSESDLVGLVELGLLARKGSGRGRSTCPRRAAPRDGIIR